MSHSPDWNAAIEDAIAATNEAWLSRAEFCEVLERLLGHPSCPFDGLQYAFEFQQPFTPFTVGRAAQGEPSSHLEVLNDERGGRCRLRWWQKNPTSSQDLDHQKLSALLVAWWKPAVRTSSAGLPDLKRNDLAIRIADSSIQQQLSQGERPAVIFCDLDNFGKVNKQLGEPVGDRVIKEFGAKAECAVEPFGVLLHDGGDELIVLCNRGGALAAIQAAYAIHETVVEHDFRIEGLEVSVSAGIAATDSPLRSANFDSLKTECAHALHEYAKKPIKGRARFDQVSLSVTSDEWTVADRAALLKCLVLSAPSDPALFGSAWLSAISRVAAKAMTAEVSSSEPVRTAVNRFVVWMGPTAGTVPIVAGSPPAFDSHPLVVQPVVSQLEIAFAVASGVVRSLVGSKVGSALTIFHSLDGLAARLEVDGHVMWDTDPHTTLTQRIDLMWPAASATGNEDGMSSARAVLIKIGHSPMTVPALLFTEIIIIDDRPTLGGSLPDFWQVAMARLVAHLNTNPNIQAVFVLGDHESAKETIKWLRDLRSWRTGSEELAHQLAVTSSMIRLAADRLEGRVKFPRSSQELVAMLAQVLDLQAPPLSPAGSVILNQRAILDRPLALGEMKLGDADGCRVETLEQAYPVILEILRKSDAPLICDQAGQKLKELVDFKVHVGCPSINMVPAYLRGEEQRMQEYFERAFLDESQFFGRALNRNDQLNRVLTYVADVIGDCEQEYATRRAILIVPPELFPANEWSPLGLVSIRLIPRFSSRRCELSFGFTWRTVEALVGFPYSLYGSVRFAQLLTERVSSLLPKQGQSRVTLGYVSYFAHSLHMFMDKFGQEIARRIVNDATR